MMTGNVRQLHAMLPVTFRFADKPDITIEFVVDTGFTGYLTLPPQAVALMGLPFLHHVIADLADGSKILTAIHIAIIVWKGNEIAVRVLATGERPLLGTALLDNNGLLVQFIEDGLVTVDDL